METKVLKFSMFLLFLVLAADVAVKITEAKLCWSRSKTFHGLCFTNSSCEAKCFNESFTGGMCKGFLQRCYCCINC
ncbi:Defensin Tk-AMP-D6 [Vigna angularis]|uniref:Defensin Tk-AMP-D6 n=1 Tax=Phaseolus angularis TaxID=3914 RepID=A0A8T0LD71_PHAAN|nr:Defensin Tk-AMP-D6 [Vigna angularis]